MPIGPICELKISLSDSAPKAVEFIIDASHGENVSVGRNGQAQRRLEVAAVSDSDRIHRIGRTIYGLGYGGDPAPKRVCHKQCEVPCAVGFKSEARRADHQRVRIGALTERALQWSLVTLH